MSATGTTFLLIGLLVADPPKLMLDKDGLPDYETILNDRLSKGITPERNAVVLLWKAFGPTSGGGKGMPTEYFRWLGIAEPPKEGDYFIPLLRHLRDHTNLDQDALYAIYEQETQLHQRPWRAADFPHIAAWLVANEKPLAVALEATKRPDYFNPIVPRKTDKEPGLLIGVGFEVAQMCRELTRALTVRAMLRLGEGKWDAAWQDLLACHRLSRQVARGATLIETLVGISLELIAANAVLTYLEQADLTAAQVRDRLNTLQGLRSLPPLSNKIDLYERYTFLDLLQIIRQGRIGTIHMMTYFGGIMNGQSRDWDQKLWDRKLTPGEQKIWDSLDWELAIQSGNRWYDRMAAALRKPTRMERQKELDQIDEDLKPLKKDFPKAAKLAERAFGKNPPDKMIVKAISDLLIGVHLPSVRKGQDGADRVEQVRRNLLVAFALAAYRRDEGRYPATLDALSPKYLAAVPGDLFSEKELVYRPEGAGYLLYSVGVNGKDDGGRWSDDDPPGDDILVRMPLPVLKPLK